jgi:hypothetical protein
MIAANMPVKCPIASTPLFETLPKARRSLNATPGPTTEFLAHSIEKCKEFPFGNTNLRGSPTVRLPVCASRIAE